jgi:hypothetical protein
MKYLQLVGLLLLALLFTLLEVAFFAAAITTIFSLIFILCTVLGIIDLKDFNMHSWFAIAAIWMMLEGCSSQIKSSKEKFVEIKKWFKDLRSGKSEGLC